MKKFKSYRVHNTIDGELEFILIAPTRWKVKDLNDLIKSGMKCIVLDQRSELVNKELVK